MKAKWFFTEQDVQDVFARYQQHNSGTSEEWKADVDIEKTFDDAGQIVGFRLNLTDGDNIITGYQETFGLYGDKFYASDMGDGEGGLKYVETESDLYK